MKLLYTLPLLFSVSAFAQTNDINDNVNWKDISSTPSVNSQVIEQDFVPADAKDSKNFVQDELVDFDFLTKSIDERVFYNFETKIRILNKYTDKITDYTLKPQEELDLKKFKVLVKSCAVTPIDNVDNQLAFIQVYRKDKLVFNGWMSNIHKNLNFPELAELYVNLISCKKIEAKK